MWTRKLPILRPSVVSRPWGKAAWGQILDVLEEHGEEQHRKKTWGSIVSWSGSNLQTVLLVFLFKPFFVSRVHGFARSASLGKWIPIQILGCIPDQINQKLGRSVWPSEVSMTFPRYTKVWDVNMSYFKSRFLLIIVKCTQSNKKSNPLHQTKYATYTYRVAK